MRKIGTKVRDIKLGNRLYYDADGRCFFHKGRGGRVCDTVCSNTRTFQCLSCKENRPCNKCGYQYSKKEIFIMRMMEFNE
jgi:hypothetical protein